MKAIRIVFFSICCVTAAYVSATAGGAPAASAQARYFGEEFAEAQRALSSKPTDEVPATF